MVVNLSLYPSFISLNPEVLIPEYEKANAKEPHKPPVLEGPSVAFWVSGIPFLSLATDLALTYIPQVAPDESIDASSRREAIDGAICGYDANVGNERVAVFFHEAKKYEGRYRDAREQVYLRCTTYLRSPNNPSELIFGMGTVGTEAAVWMCRYNGPNDYTFSALTRPPGVVVTNDRQLFIDAADTIRGPQLMASLQTVFDRTRAEGIALAPRSFLNLKPPPPPSGQSQTSAVSGSSRVYRQITSTSQPAVQSPSIHTATMHRATTPATHTAASYSRRLPQATAISFAPRAGNESISVSGGNTANLRSLEQGQSTTIAGRTYTRTESGVMYWNDGWRLWQG